ERTARLRRELEFPTEDRGSDALVLRTEQHVAGRARDLDGIEHLVRRTELDVDAVRIAEAQVDVLFDVRLTALFDRDAVRSADAQAAGAETTVLIRDGPADRAGLGVQDRDFGSRDRGASRLDHATTEGGGCLLGVHRRSSDERNRERQCKLGFLRHEHGEAPYLQEVDYKERS